ncbi:SH3 domain-containing protein [Brucella sp. BE17]|uniref:SH3 domain-containing protein n=1 Tax=Brucella sp. BE17 TaxID=3142977 RepID=UPI0031BA1A71
MKAAFKSSIVILAILFSTGAQANNAIATTTVNLRSGPGTQYPSLGRIPNGVVINVAGCTTGYGWCRVNYRGLEGWTASQYIAVQTGGPSGGSGDFGTDAAAIGIPLIAGLVIGAAIQSDRDDDRWRRDRWRDDWGPGPYRPGPYWRGPGYWGPPRPHWTDRPGWSGHPGYHPNFDGPSNWGMMRR